MVQYIQALEGFDRECEAMHTNIIMGEFMATESVGSSIKAGVQAAWEKLKRLVLGIWEKIKSFAGKIKSGVQALIAMIRKSPNETDAGKHAREMSEWLQANDTLADTSLQLVDVTLKDIEDLRTLGKKLSKAERAELDGIEKDIETKLQTYEEAVKAEKAANEKLEACFANWKGSIGEDGEDESSYRAARDATDDAWSKRLKANGEAFKSGVNGVLITGEMMQKHGLDPKKNNPPKSKAEGTEDSFIGNTSFEPATEAEGGRKFNLSGLKQKLTNLLGRSEKATAASEQFIDEIKNDFESIKNSSGDDQTANKKQSLLSKILNFGTRIFNSIKSIPGKIKDAFGRLWSLLRRGRSQVKPYNGPSPVAATDSYLYDPELAVEIG